VALAREEGVAFVFGHRPAAFSGEREVRDVACVTPGGPVRLRCDLAIIAFGQRPAPPSWLHGLGIETEPDGRIRVDARGRTTRPGVWAGGDNTLGPGLAVTAMAVGRAAAADMLGVLKPRSVAVHRPAPPMVAGIGERPRTA
jgi:glutamate synthase (NADPH/NADH) small chain